MPATGPGRHRGPREIDSVTTLAAYLDAGGRASGLRLESLDLSDIAPTLLARDDLDGVVVLGGRISDELADHVRHCGGLVFPDIPDTPVPIFRSSLHSAAELYAGLDQGYQRTCDAAAYLWSRTGTSQRDVYTTLLRAIHDDQISDALDEGLQGESVVAVMGGHALARDSPDYRTAAELGHRLAESGYIVMTGGGPGAMEAANLGAFAPTMSAVQQAVDELASVPSFTDDPTRWAGSALTVRSELESLRDQGSRSRVRSIGIPTWFYGHEPPNVFCDGIAKYFSNALREDGLLSRANTAIVVLPGAAGTVQEIFQAATALYYPSDADRRTQLILVGEDHWSRTIPVWQTLTALAGDRPMAQSIHLVDAAPAAAELITAGHAASD